MQIKTKTLSLLFNLVYSQVQEVTVRSTEDGWKIRAVDPSHTSMISASVPIAAFVDYKQTEDFALDLKNVIKALNNAGSVCDLTIGDGVFVVESGGLRSKFPLISVSENDPKIPEIQYTAGCTIPIEGINKLSSSVYGNVDTYTFVIANEALTVAAEDESRNGVTLTLRKDDCLKISGEAKSTFAIDLFDRFLKCLPKDCVFDINLGNDYPMEVLLDSQDWSAKYLIAPRIVNDE